MDHVSIYRGDGMALDPNGYTNTVANVPVSFEGDYTAGQGGKVYYGQLNWGVIQQ